MEEINDIEECELDVWSNSALRFYVTALFKGEQTLEQFKDDLLSFRNSEYYKGSKEEYKIIKED